MNKAVKEVFRYIRYRRGKGSSSAVPNTQIKMNYNNGCDKGKYMNTKIKIKNKGWALNKTVWIRLRLLEYLKEKRLQNPLRKIKEIRDKGCGALIPINIYYRRSQQEKSNAI